MYPRTFNCRRELFFLWSQYSYSGPESVRKQPAKRSFILHINMLHKKRADPLGDGHVCRLFPRGGFPAARHLLPSLRLAVQSTAATCLENIYSTTDNSRIQELSKHICHVSVHDFSVIVRCMLSGFPLAIFANLRESIRCRAPCPVQGFQNALGRDVERCGKKSRSVVRKIACIACAIAKIRLSSAPSSAVPRWTITDHDILRCFLSLSTN